MAARRLRFAALLPLLAVAFGCAPKAGTSSSGSTGATGGSGPTATTGATKDRRPGAGDFAEIRALLASALGAGRTTWSDPVIRPGERVRWRVGATAGPDLVIEVVRRESDGTWIVKSGTETSFTRTVEADLAPDGATASRLAWTGAKGKTVTITDAPTLIDLYPTAKRVDETTFAAAGGRLLGNEVVRVAAGEFRARHEVLDANGATWHFYVARAVPGGLVKIEKFEPGALDPSATWELEDFYKLPKPAPTPNPEPLVAATPAPSPTAKP